MALALLDLVDTQDDGGYRFAVDTGTNTEFEIRIGGGVVRRAGADFVEPVSFATPRRRTDGSPMGSATEVGVRPTSSYCRVRCRRAAARSHVRTAWRPGR
jgi:hypothetical protein